MLLFFPNSILNEKQHILISLKKDLTFYFRFFFQNYDVNVKIKMLRITWISYWNSFNNFPCVLNNNGII